MKTPLISILIPAFKTAFFKECLYTIVNQTYESWEVIVVDDCSPEPIEEIVLSIHSSKIKYFRNEKNYGAVDVVDNWNKCLEYALGDYCICIGDDDMLPPETLEIYVKYIEKYPNIDVFHARTILIDQTGNPIYITNTRAEYESVYSLIRHRMNDELQFVGDFCYRIQKLRDMGGYKKLPLAWGSDDITAYMMAEEKGIVNIIEPTFYYRVNSLSITSTCNVDVKINAIEEQRRWFVDFLGRSNNLSLEESLSITTIKSKVDKYLDKKIAGYISEDIRKKRRNILYWIKNRKKYNISSYALKYGIIRSFC